jgi:hypothetical protein
MLMLICFGVSWPVSVAKSLKTKVVAGKSPTFMIIIACGYAAGIIHKILYSFDWVLTLYIINLLFVLADLFLYYYYTRIHLMDMARAKYDIFE